MVAPQKPLISDLIMVHPLMGLFPTKLFMLANNKVSYYCPSTFSTSTRCLYTTGQQRKFVNTRGNNVSGCKDSF